MNTRRIRMTVVALVAGAAMVAGAGDSTWTNWAAGATGEYWTNALNWTNAAGANVLPDNGHAILTRADASYTVVYDTAAPAISNLVVRNGAGNQTTLTLSAPLSHVGGSITLSTGAVVNVANGAVWSYLGTLPDANTTLLDVSRGADLEVCGGTVRFTNVQRSVGSAWNTPTIQIGNASTGTLRVTAGKFTCSTPNTGANDSHEMYVGNGVGGNGTLEIAAGSSVLLGRANGNKILYVGREGGRGRVLVAGDVLTTG